MLYLIGLGLSEKSFGLEAREAIDSSTKIYLESYTVEFPYKKEDLEKQLKGKKIIPVDREFVEQKLDELIKEAKTNTVSLLVYGSPLTATTHITIIDEAKKNKVKVKVIHSSSIFDAIAETGLQVYKFGKTASLPAFKADSYIDLVKDNQKIKAHTLILVDIGMTSKEAIEKLEKDSKDKKLKLEKIVICSQLGAPDSKILYDTLKNLKDKKVKAPFCIIIPSELHFVEKGFLEQF